MPPRSWRGSYHRKPSNMKTIQQQTTIDRPKYLRRAANWARKHYTKLSELPEWKGYHASHVLAQALRDCERRYSDLGTFGVEHLYAGRGRNSPAITYLNAGDAYEWTILYVRGQFLVGCWGDIVDRGNYQ